MNTLKFTPKNELAKELHNLAYVQTKNIHLCVDEEIADDIYWNKLEAICKNKSDDKARVEISLRGVDNKAYQNRLVASMEYLYVHGINVRTFVTDGRILDTFYKGKPFYTYMVKYGVTHNINLNFDACKLSNECIKRLAFAFYVNGGDFRISVSCNKGMEILVRLKELEGFCVKEFIFREGNALFSEMLTADYFVENGFQYIRTLKDSEYIVDVYYYHSKCNTYVVKHYKERDLYD